MTKYDVFWTFVANFADSVRTVEADSIKEAIEKCSAYDPYETNEHGNRMNFIVWKHGEGLVHEGPITDLEEVEEE